MTALTKTFLRAVMHGLPAGHHVALWRQDSHTHEWVADPADAATHAVAVDAAGADVYVTQAFWPVGMRARKANTAAGLLGLCLDIDVNESPERDGTRKTGAAPTLRDALTLATSIAPPTLIVFSGGGIQPWWLFDEPCVVASDDDRREAECLATAWQAAHAALVPWRIDSTHDLARVRRIPGTHNHKSAPARPVTVKKTPGALRHSVSDLSAVVARAPADSAPARAWLNGHATVPDDRMAAIVAMPGVAAVLAAPPADQSARDHAVAKEAMRAYVPDAEIADLIAHLRADDPKRKGARPDYVDRTVAKARAEVREEARPTRARRVTLTRSSDMQPEQVTSAWAPYLPMRSLSLLAGAPGLGKSTMHAYIAAHLSRGTFDGVFRGKPTGVVIVTAEDSLTATVTPRLMAAGAELDHVRLLQVEVDGTTGLLNLAADLPALQEAVADVGARVVLLDPLVAFFDRVDSHNDQQVRRILAPLAQWADEHNLAINGLIHTNKREGHDALTRVSGSIAFTGVARSLLMMGRHPDDEDESAVHLVHEKYNLGKRGPSWRCLLIDAPVMQDGKTYPASRIVFDGPSDASGSDLVSPTSSPDERGAMRDAVAWFKANLADGKERSADDTRKRCVAEVGVSDTTANRAKRAAGVKSRQVPGKAHGGWVWFLPQDESQASRKGQDR